MKCEIKNYIFFLHCYIQIHWSIFHSEWKYHLESIILLRYPNISNINTFYYIILSITLINCITSLIRKVSKNEAVPSHNGRDKFPNFQFSFWKIKFYHWQQILPDVFLQVAGSVSLFTIEKTSTKYWALNKHFFSVSLSFK